MVSDGETWLQSENLLTTKQTLRGPGGTLLPVMGLITARFFSFILFPLVCGVDVR